MRKSKVKNFDFYIIILIFAFCLLNFIGCATVSTKEALPTFNINGTAYLPLVCLCDLRKIDLAYDTFSQTAVLKKGGHKVNLMVGETLVLVDGSPWHLKHPVNIYQGTVVVPDKFKAEILDKLFREPTALTKPSLPLLRIKKVVVDAGHGGSDAGAVGRKGLREKYVNLDIAKRLRNLLHAEGIEVVMTRSGDKFVPLSRRVEIANNSGAELFISVHSNANRVRSLNGFEVYYLSENINNAQRAEDSAREGQLNLDNRYFYQSTPDLKAILWDMRHNYHRAESVELARAICQQVDEDVSVRSFRIKPANFYVLKGVRMPAVLIETGFLSNSDEERLLKNSYYRQRIAESIVEGIKDYARDYTLAKVEP